VAPASTFVSAWGYFQYAPTRAPLTCALVGTQIERLHPLRLRLKKAERGTESALIQLLLPITRLLVTEGTGIDKLIRAAKRAYLRAAVEAILPKGKRVNISLLSVATGMTRKEVSSLLRDSQSDRDDVTRIHGEQRALRVLRGWLTDPRFHDRSGHADAIPYRGDAKSFARLVKLYGGDVTPKPVQRELERMGLIDINAEGVLRLRTPQKRRYVEAYQISDLARLFEDFAFAIMRPQRNSELPSFFGFKDSMVPSAADAAFFISRFSRRAAALLEDFQEWSAGRASPSPTSQRRGAVRVGLGVYLVRAGRSENHNAAKERRGRTALKPRQKRHR
jgi:hypothetical protein